MPNIENTLIKILRSLETLHKCDCGGSNDISIILESLVNINIQIEELLNLLDNMVTIESDPIFTAWLENYSPPTEFPPSAHSHIINDVTDLQTALNAKLDTTATAYDSARLGGELASNFYTKIASDAMFKPIGYHPTWTQVTNKPTEFPPIAHIHSDTEVNLTETYTGNLAGAVTQKDANDILDSLVGGVLETNLVASNELKFDTLNQYGSILSARAGDITVNFTDAKLGIVQVMFHDDSEIPPEILSNNKFVILQGYYTADAINRISFELVDKTTDSEVILVSIIPCE